MSFNTITLRLPTLILLVCINSVLAACGQKGPLYLPAPKPASAPEPASIPPMQHPPLEKENSNSQAGKDSVKIKSK